MDFDRLFGQHDFAMTTNTKISVAFLEYVQPLLDLLFDESSPEQRDSLIQTPIMVWNAVVLEKLGRETHYLDQARDLLVANSTGIQRDLMTQLVNDLEERKRSEKPLDLRIIGDARFIEDEDGNLRLQVSCHLPESVRSPSSRRS